MDQVTQNPTLTGRIEAQRPPHRLERLAAVMEEQRLDCIVAFGADEANYVAGYWRYYGGPSGVVLARDGERTLAVMRDEVPVAERLGEANVVHGFGERGFGIELNPLPLLAGTVAGVPALTSARRVGIADGLGPMRDLLATHLSAELVGIESELARLRLRKDEDELAKMAHAYELCWLGQAAVAEAVERRDTEIEAFSAALSAAQIAHGEPIEFLADVLSGPDTCEVCCPIRIASPRGVETGDPLIADVVVRADGYWGDSAETHVAGSNLEVEHARATLLEILESARTELVPGHTGAAIFAEMDARVRAAYPQGELPHHGGHALGLTSFEDPHLIPSDKTPLESWMVIAVEPGVYVPGRFGARVENVFIVTPDGGVELRDAMGIARG